MPRKSHETPKPAPRPERSVVQDHIQEPDTACYLSFAEFSKRCNGLKTLQKWSTKSLGDRVVFKKMVDEFLLPELEIIVDDSLAFTVKAFGCFLPEHHLIYTRYRRSMRNLTICTLVKELENFKLCQGVSALELTSKLYHHVIPCSAEDYMNGDEGSEGEQDMFPSKGYWRSTGCWLMCTEDDSVCDTCATYSKSSETTFRSKQRWLSTPASVKSTSIWYTSRKD